MRLRTAESGRSTAGLHREFCPEGKRAGLTEFCAPQSAKGNKIKSDPRACTSDRTPLIQGGPTQFAKQIEARPECIPPLSQKGKAFLRKNAERHT